MAGKLPSELVREILSTIFDLRDERFHDISDVSPFARVDHISSAHYVPICKACLPVATILLYHTVIIRSTAQANTLEHTLHNNDVRG
jgi:hypothetical protein